MLHNIILILIDKYVRNHYFVNLTKRNLLHFLELNIMRPTNYYADTKCTHYACLSPACLCWSLLITNLDFNVGEIFITINDDRNKFMEL